MAVPTSYFQTPSRLFSQQGNKKVRGYGAAVGGFHYGIDLAWDKNPITPVTAHSSGTVIRAEYH